MESPNSPLPTPEVWQVDVNGQVYDTSFEEMQQWIAEGALLPVDKVRRGNLRWLEANKVPSLHRFFNAKELGIEIPVVSTTINTTVQPNETNTSESTPTFNQNSVTTNFPPPNSFQDVQDSLDNACVLHPELEAKFSCGTCLSKFCKGCPNTYGSVKICPMCGAMCKPLEITSQKFQNTQFYNGVTGKFGFSDFTNALGFPFRYKASLIFGAVMFMILTLGQSSSAFGGIYLIFASLICAMLANTLTFGILANTVDNFSQGNIESNFMPNFDDFNMWDDVLHPFFLSLAAYIASFGPFILILVAMTFFVMNSMKSEANPIAQKVVATTAPDIQRNYDSASQIPQIKSITDQVNEKNAQHNQQIENAQNGVTAATQTGYDEEKEFENLNNQINQQRKQQLESTFGKAPETEQAEFIQMAQKMLGVAIPFLLFGGIALLWGLFYFPAACAVAGYTRNFASTINPLVGIDTIKRLGFDYVKILGMCILLFIMSGIATVILRIVLSPFDLPRMGNLPAIAIGSIFTFYFSIVFSVILGYALYKNADKLKLFR